MGRIANPQSVSWVPPSRLLDPENMPDPLPVAPIKHLSSEVLLCLTDFLNLRDLMMLRASGCKAIWTRLQNIMLGVRFDLPYGQSHDYSPNLILDPFPFLSEFSRLETVELYRVKFAPNQNKPSPFLSLPATLKTLVCQLLVLNRHKVKDPLFFMNINWNEKFPLLETLRIGNPRCISGPGEPILKDDWLQTLPRQLRNLSLVFSTYDPMTTFVWVTRPTTVNNIPVEHRFPNEISIPVESVAYHYPLLERLELSNPLPLPLNPAMYPLPPSIRWLKFTASYFVRKYPALPPTRVNTDGEPIDNGLQALDLSFYGQNTYDNWWTDIPAPQNLVSLRLVSVGSLPPPEFISTHFNGLVSIDIPCSWTGAHFKHLPIHIESLKIATVASVGAADLKAWLRSTTRLHTFHVGHNTTNEVLDALPLTLTELQCTLEMDVDPHLPPSLLTFISSIAMNPKHIGLLPRSITHLEISIPYSEPAIIDLPPTLRFLSIYPGSIPIESIPSLPQTLHWIRFGDRLILPPTPPKERGMLAAISRAVFSRSNGTNELIQSTMSLFPPHALVDARFVRDNESISTDATIKLSSYAYRSTWYRLIRE